MPAAASSGAISRPLTTLPMPFVLTRKGRSFAAPDLRVCDTRARDTRGEARLTPRALRTACTQRALTQRALRACGRAHPQARLHLGDRQHVAQPEGRLAEARKDDAVKLPWPSGQRAGHLCDNAVGLGLEAGGQRLEARRRNREAGAPRVEERGRVAAVGERDVQPAPERVCDHRCLSARRLRVSERHGGGCAQQGVGAPPCGDPAGPVLGPFPHRRRPCGRRWTASLRCGRIVDCRIHWTFQNL